MGAKPRVAVYTRISKDSEHNGLGVERQEIDCREVAKRLGAESVRVFSDDDTSAYTGTKRERYEAMLAGIERGEIDAVAAWHHDRLHRSPTELERYIDLCQPRDIPTYTAQGGDLDLTTASGRMTARIVGAVARHESEHSSERIRARKLRDAAAGTPLGGARPFGWGATNTKTVGGGEVEFMDLTLPRWGGVPHAGEPSEYPGEADLLADACRRVLQKDSVYAIAKEWNEAGVRTPRGNRWSETNLKRTLVNPRHAGMLVHNGAVANEQAWERIIEPELHRDLVRKLTDPSRASFVGSRSLKWVGSGLYVCGRCGGVMRSASSPQSGDTPVPLYRCRTGKHVTIHARVVDEAVTAVIEELLRTRGAELLPVQNNENTDRNREALTTARGKLEEIGDMLGDGDLSRAEFTRQRKRLTDKIETLSAQLSRDAGRSPLSGYADAADPVAAYHAAHVSARRAIVDALVTVTIHPARPGRAPRGAERQALLDRVQITAKDES